MYITIYHIDVSDFPINFRVSPGLRFRRSQAIREVQTSQSHFFCPGKPPVFSWETQRFSWENLGRSGEIWENLAKSPNFGPKNIGWTGYNRLSCQNIPKLDDPRTASVKCGDHARDSKSKWSWSKPNSEDQLTSTIPNRCFFSVNLLGFLWVISKMKIGDFQTSKRFPI